ncbi:cell division protein FtsA [Clostridium thermosuccinogenes]|uniref:Cell division protein FtsA n=1 Tax=Clostridium thermosuccinogenes TaxID=84032 RepID=A0A2K2FMP3_9CLOT|nr:cell division protein FtsA [Pseudoclostridium thermosuccinogenes]AUS96568.1 cell division protein FtsA [Pseudoclostridium thermosuccinogenes]PNT98004.1 cell division protein FtsA [Pseudoclostridium thermosuccinogenes]PNU00024.1 cell division protein FtsA [Pseudoclostridium thermosuccinogenes]
MADIVVGIDIGTTKVCTLIGRLKEGNKIETLGRGVAPCSGVKKGVIVDLESTAGSIANSIRQAENMAQLKVESAYINISGAHVDIIKTLNEISISNEDHEVTSHDVERLLFMAGNTEIAQDRQIIDIIPNQYILDGYEEILDPTGMTGVKLALDADVVAGKLTSVQNIVRSIGKSGIKLDGFIVEALATASIALTSDEREIGAILIDIGGGVTDVSIFKKNRLIFYDSIPVGGDHITNDISIGLKIPAHEAEKLKKEYELALTSLINNDQEVSVTDGDTGRKKSVKVSEIVDIIEARVTEIFTLCRDRIADSGIYESLNAGVVLTGGGISYLQGAEQIAGSVFELPAKVANYKAYGITKPEHITSAGIVKHASERSKYSTVKSTTRVQKSEADGRKTGNTGILGKVFEFFRRLF